MIRVGVRILRVLILRVLRVVILRVREEYLENTPRAGAYAHTREGKDKRRDARRGRDTRYETRVTRGAESSSRGALGMHMKCTRESLLKNY